MSSTHHLCDHDDYDDHLRSQVRCRGDSINFMQMPSGDIDESNFYPVKHSLSNVIV